MTAHFELSIMIGTRAMSGSEAIRFRNRVIAAAESSIASSMLMSMTWAPFSTCWRATASASSYFSARIRRANAFEPVTLVRSPTLTNSELVVDVERLEARQAHRLRDLGDPARAQVLDGGGDRGDVLGRGAAAAAGDVDEARLGERAQQARGDVGRLVEPGLGHRIRQAGVRVDADPAVGLLRQLLDVGPHQRGAERAVEADGDRVGVADRVPERLDGLARQDPAAGVGDGARDHHRDPCSPRCSRSAYSVDQGEDRRLGVQRVEDGLDQKDVDAPFDQRLGLLGIGRAQLLEGDVARARVVDVGRNRRGLRLRAERAGDEPRPVGRAVLVAGLAGEPGRGAGSSRGPRLRGGSRPGRSRVAPKVLVSMRSAPAARYWSWISAMTCGWVSDSSSLLPLRSCP